MLVLTRRSGEAILIGDDVVVTVLEVSRDQVRLGIRAPRSVAVHREEVYQEIVLANRAAAGPDDATSGSTSTPAVTPGTTAHPVSPATLPTRPR